MRGGGPSVQSEQGRNNSRTGETQVFRRIGHEPGHLISDQGRQFITKEFKRWGRRGFWYRFGAAVKHGSLVVIEQVPKDLVEGYDARRASLRSSRKSTEYA